VTQKHFFQETEVIFLPSWPRGIVRQPLGRTASVRETSSCQHPPALSEPAALAKYLFTLAQAFNLFYHKHRIIKEEDPSKKRFLLALTGIIRNQLSRGLSLLGISVPERM
jgi:hypothetical protein